MEVKADINRIILSRVLRLIRFAPGDAKDWHFIFLSKVGPKRVKLVPLVHTQSFAPPPLGGARFGGAPLT